MSFRNEHRLLNRLIELCRDEALTLREVASHVKDVEARKVLEELAAERVAFAADLLPHAQRLGGVGASGGTTRGALHRRWLALKSRVPGVGDRAMIADAEHAEEYALAAYSRALDDLLQPTSRDVVERQRDGLAVAHDRVRALIVH